MFGRFVFLSADLISAERALFVAEGCLVKAMEAEEVTAGEEDRTH